MSTAAGDAGGLEVRVDRIRCVGTGLCAAAAPADVQLGPDGRAVPRHARAEASERLTEAAEMCPTEALTVHLAATGELVAPLD
ncbi:ferredoxin [Streptomyces sp. NRRL B-24484]|uniref:ferredoxin n=1 Tax=Streptomyces sp. NRRL B-24484 TaxID=1463833 RepID=UPI0006947366|nr:ferredoxin [Streptomyces sp. NRRL B-24484]